MERFEYSITQLQKSLKTSQGWLQVSQNKLGFATDDTEKWQEFVEKYQAEVNDLESAIEHLQDIRDKSLYILERESGEDGEIVREKTEGRVLL